MFGGKTKNRAFAIAHLQYEHPLPVVTRKDNRFACLFSNAQHTGKVHCAVCILLLQAAIYLSGNNGAVFAASFRQAASRKQRPVFHKAFRQ
jgi:hypothetical protein